MPPRNLHWEQGVQRWATGEGSIGASQAACQACSFGLCREGEGLTVEVFLQLVELSRDWR